MGTAPLVLPEAKSIYGLEDTGSKFLTPSGGPDEKAYRTSPLVLPEAKTIYNLGDTGSKFLTPSGEPDESAYRTAPVVHPQPKPIYNFGEQGNKYLTPSGKPDEHAYRTNPIVHAEPKACHKPGEQGNKHLTRSSGPINETNLPYRNSSFGVAHPKTVNESRIVLALYYIFCIQHVKTPFQVSATGPRRWTSTRPPPPMSRRSESVAP